MSQPNKQSDLSNLPISLQQRLLFQRQQARVAAAVAQNQNQNQMPIPYLPQNLTVQAQAKQMNRVATPNSVAALQLMQQKQQQINAAAVAQQQQQYITKQNFLAKQNQLQNLQAQQILQQQKIQQQRQENMVISIINELNKVTAELQQPNISEMQKQALFNRRKGLEELIAKIRIMKQQQNQKDKQPQLQINPTDVNQAQLIEQIKQQRLQQFQIQQLQKQQQQQFQKQQLSNLYQQSLASTSKPNVISQQSLQQLTPQQVQILSNMTNNPMINQTLLKQQQMRLQKQQMQKLGLFQNGQIDLQQQQTHPGILGANNISNISLPTSVTSTSVVPTSTLATATTNLQATNLQATSKLSMQLAQPKVEPKAGTPTISTSTIKSVSTEALSKANVTVNMSQINNLNPSSTPNFSPKTTIENSSKQEKIKTPTTSTKNSTSTNNSVSNLNNLNNKSVTGTATPLNSVVTATTAKVMSPIQKQAEILKTQQKQLSPISKVKKEIVTTPSNTINKDAVDKDAINNSYLAKSTINVVPSPSLSAKINTPKANLSKSFSPLNKATTTAVVSPVTNLKAIKSSPQVSSKIPANMPSKTTIDNKKTPPIVQSPALKNKNVASPIISTTNKKIINNTTIPITQSIPLVNSVDITKNAIVNNIKKETPNVNGKLLSNKSFSPIEKPHVNGNISSQDNKNESITTPNKYFSPKMNPTRSSSTSSINNLSPSNADKSQALVNGNININQNKTLPFNNNNTNNNNTLYINNKNPMLMSNNGLKVLESLKQHGAFTNIILPKSPFQSTKVFTEISSTNCIRGPPLKISGKLLEKRKREEKFHDMVFNSNVSTKKRNIKQLVNEITPNEKLSGYTEQLLFDIADDLIDQMTIFASKMAKHRNSTKIEAKDVQISLGNNYIYIYYKI